MTSDEDRNTVRDLFEKALGDYLSVEIWLEYIQFSISDMGQPNGLELIRTVCERSLDMAGLDVTKGYSLWEAYREFECAILSGLQVIIKHFISQCLEFNYFKNYTFFHESLFVHQVKAFYR